jgi:hypothetical protein
MGQSQPVAAVQTEMKVARMRKVAFLHIPKCGGISIETILQAAYPKKDVSPLYFTRDFTPAAIESLTAYSLVIGHFDFDTLKRLQGDFLKAIVFREPLSLLVSLYNHAGSRPAHRLNAQIVAGELSFEKFCGQAPGSRNILSKSLLGREAYALLTKSGSGDQLGTATDMVKRNLATIDCVGMIDNLDGFRMDLMRKLGVELAKLPKLNSSPKLVELDRLTSAETDSFVRYNQMDIAVYRTIREIYEAKDGIC